MYSVYSVILDIILKLLMVSISVLKELLRNARFTRINTNVTNAKLIIKGFE
jgi:hypothetical protein